MELLRLTYFKDHFATSSALSNSLHSFTKKIRYLINNHAPQNNLVVSYLPIFGLHFILLLLRLTYYLKHSDRTEDRIQIFFLTPRKIFYIYRFMLSTGKLLSLLTENNRYILFKVLTMCSQNCATNPWSVATQNLGMIYNANIWWIDS